LFGGSATDLRQIPRIGDRPPLVGAGWGQTPIVGDLAGASVDPSNIRPVPNSRAMESGKLKRSIVRRFGDRSAPDTANWGQTPLVGDLAGGSVDPPDIRPVPKSRGLGTLKKTVRPDGGARDAGTR
jgi:hypothetical protein